MSERVFVRGLQGAKYNLKAARQARLASARVASERLRTWRDENAVGHEDASPTYGVRQLDVRIAITHDKGAFETQAMLACCLFQQAGQRFAAGTILLAGVSAIVVAIDARPGGGQFMTNARVNLRYQ